MKGIILAGGTGSRLYPLTKVTNKHLLPVGRYPMIFHAVAKMAEAGVSDVLVVTGTEHMGAVVGALGSGDGLDMAFTYRVQEKPGGIAQALGLARGFIGREPFIVILGDNIFEDSLAPLADAFASQGGGARLVFKEVPDPHRYGVPVFMDGRLSRIEEKPALPQSRYCVTGIYFYDSFALDVIPELRPSARGELEITDVNNAYLNRGDLHYSVLHGWWTDAGTHASLQQANALAKDTVLPLFESKGAP